MCSLYRKCIGIAVDAILYSKRNKEKKVLLIKRKKDPFKHKYALPGGFVNYGERLEEAIEREVKEETGIKATFKVDDQFHAFSSPSRDPRGHIITIVYKKQLPLQQLEKAVERESIDKKEISKMDIFSLNSLPPLAFDHAEILSLFNSKV